MVFFCRVPAPQARASDQIKYFLYHISKMVNTCCRPKIEVDRSFLSKEYLLCVYWFRFLCQFFNFFFFFLIFFNLVKNKFAIILNENHKLLIFIWFATMLLSCDNWFGSLRLYDPYVILLGRNYFCVFFNKKKFFFFLLHTRARPLVSLWALPAPQDRASYQIKYFLYH